MQKIKLIFTLSCLFCLFNANTQSLTLKGGGNFNRTIGAADPDIPFNPFEDFSPKNGYQAGLVYKHPLYKSFFLDAELGYLNKGYKARRRTTTNELVFNLEYNYLTFTPSVGYETPLGLSLKVGLGINRLLTTKGPNPRGVDQTEYAISTVLAYNYKRFGLELSHSNNVKVMQKFEFGGIKYENYHEWYAASLTFQLFEKRTKTP